MTYLWATILVLVNAACLVLDLLGLPGNWLMLAGTFLVAWLERDRGMFSPYTLLAGLLLAGIGEVLELLAGAIGARKGGAGRRGAIGALAGGLLGALVGTAAIPVPLLGSLLGACAGACLGAWALELSGGRTARASLRAGVGAGVGRAVGTILKLAIGVMLWFLIAIAAFTP